MGRFFAMFLLGACGLVACGRDAGEDALEQTAAVTSSEVGPTRVDVPARGAYGDHTFDVPADAYWVSSGLYLRAGEQATVRVSGTWTAEGRALGPDGDATRPERGCGMGGLVARSELVYGDPSLYCLGRDTTITAARDGIVYFGSLAGTDLGADTFEARRGYTGALTVTLASNGRTAPWVDSAAAATFAFEEVESGRVELYGKHVIVVASTSQAIADRADIAASIALLDEIYDAHARLRGATPFGGQRMRFIDDDSAPGYMLAGNPVRMKSTILRGDGNARLLRSADPAYDVWGFAHEMGHMFATTPATNWWYQIDGFVEAWPNVFSVTTLESLGRASEWGGHDPHYPSAKICPGRATYLASGTYADLKSDYPLMLCFLLEMRETYGDGFYPRFFAELNAAPPASVPQDEAKRWGWLRDRFSEAAGMDATPIFEKWQLPLR